MSSRAPFAIESEDAPKGAEGEKTMNQERFLSMLTEAFGSNARTGAEADKAAHKALWNQGCRNRPNAFVSCSDTGQVQTAVELATSNAVPLSVLGGGRHPAGFGVAEGGLVLDLSPMSQVRINPGRQTVIVGGGSRINDVLLTLPDDLVSVTGAVSNVGYAGLMLGGGYGPLNSRFGLVCDTLQSAEVVLADGRVVQASDKSNADLLWALRGSGGNYGVVTSFELKLFPLDKVQSATVAYPLASAANVMRQVQKVVEAACDELSVLSGLVTLPHGPKGLFLQPLLSSQSAEGERLFEELCSLDGAHVVKRRWSPYKEIFDREAEKAWSANQNYRVSARFCEELSEEVIQLLMEGAEAAPTRGSVLLLHDFHGQASRIPFESAAYPLRTIHYLIEVIAGWDSEAEGKEALRWFDRVLGDLSKLALPGGYPNVMGPEERQRSHEFYEPSGVRLRAVKEKFDPQNVFFSNVAQP